MTTTEKGAALEVVTPRDHELVDLRSAETDRVAAVMDEIQTVRDDLADLEAHVGDELLRRLDRRGQWTLRVGDPAVVQYEIKAPSPDAGTTAWDAVRLETELRTLVERYVIDPEGAAGALERTVTITASVPLNADLDLVAKAIKGVSITIGGVALWLGDVSTTRKVRDAGVKALLKVPGAKTAVERARQKVPGPARRAKVKTIRPAR